MEIMGDIFIKPHKLYCIKFCVRVQEAHGPSTIKLNHGLMSHKPRWKMPKRTIPKSLNQRKLKEVPRLNALSSSNFVIQNLKANANLRNDPAEFWFYPQMT